MAGGGDEGEVAGGGGECEVAGDGSRGRRRGSGGSCSDSYLANSAWDYDAIAPSARSVPCVPRTALALDFIGVRVDVRVVPAASLAFSSQYDSTLDLVLALLNVPSWCTSIAWFLYANALIHSIPQYRHLLACLDSLQYKFHFPNLKNS